jgi:endonuclease/exonuclease/phosphatase family metal-dependent hydrolase
LSWLAAATVLALAAIAVAAATVTGPSHSPASHTSSAVTTAPASTAPTPSVGAVTRLVGPEVSAPAQKRGGECRGRLTPTLRVLQFNIRAGISGTGEVDLAQIAKEIEAVHPDLVSLNEVDNGTLRTRADEPSYLADATGLHAVYGPNLIYDGGRFGNAVLTRYPVVESRNLRLPGKFGLEPRGLLTVVVRVEGHRIAFASTHLSDGAAGRQSRILQALTVAGALRSSAAPTILAGDLNSVPSDLPVRILRRSLLDAQEEGGTGDGDTIPEPSPSARFDYVLYDEHFAVVPDSTHVRSSASSDHTTMFTELTLLPGHGC